tara:strand:+ start:3440 stop:3640 length:201 start_codon:yes stop_codon:yes gene_type:complete
MIKIYRNAIQTERAFIDFENIQYLSWSKHQEDYEVKIYSNAGYILQIVSTKEFNELLNMYKMYKGV